MRKVEPSLMVKKVSVPCKGNRKGLKDYLRMILEILF